MRRVRMVRMRGKGSEDGEEVEVRGVRMVRRCRWGE